MTTAFYRIPAAFWTIFYSFFGFHCIVSCNIRETCVRLGYWVVFYVAGVRVIAFAFDSLVWHVQRIFVSFVVIGWVTMT